MWVALSTAAINFNDGFGGGTNASRNLLFNTCRETGGEDPCTRALSLSVRPLARRHATLLCICPDALSLSISACLSLSLSAVRDCACAVSDHGPINSWDRNAFISDVKYGTPSYTSAMNHVVKKKHVAFPSRCMHAVQTL